MKFLQPPNPALAQASTHASADTDTGATSLHHTIGPGVAQVVGGTDARLGDARVPLAHNQSYTTVTGLGGVATLSIGTTINTVAAGDDARMTNARTPSNDAALVHLTGTETVTGTKSFDNPLISDLVRSAPAQQGVLHPAFKNQWNDRMRFLPPATLEVAPTVASPVWTTTGAPTTAAFLAVLAGQTLGSVAMTTALPSLRATWNTTYGFSFGQLQQMMLGFGYSATPPTSINLIWESSADGITWTSRANKVFSANQTWVSFAVTDNSGDGWLRLTLLCTMPAAASSALRMFSVFSPRPGDQGAGEQNNFPYTWDGARNMATVGTFSATGGVTSAGQAVVLTNDTRLSVGTIGAGTDLNTMTATGRWQQPSNANATIVLNYPVTWAGLLEVAAGYTYQRYTAYEQGGDRVFVRGYYTGTWSAWSELAKVGHVQDAATITTGTLAVARGGTNAVAVPALGAVAVGNGTSYAFTAPGSALQVLASNGPALPTWQSLDMTYMPSSAFKKSCRTATTANVTLSAPQTVDTIALIAGDRVLVKNQTLPATNGIYTVNAAAWTRVAGGDTSSEIASAIVSVDSGSQGGTQWTNAFKTTDTIDTTAMPWYSVLDSSLLGVASGIAVLDGASHIPVAQLPVGTTAGTVAAGNDGRFSSMGGWKSLADSGGDPTGVADSSPALQALINSIDPVAGGVILVHGHFYLASTVLVDRPITFMGGGAGDQYAGSGSLNPGTGGSRTGTSNVSGVNYDARNAAAACLFMNTLTLTALNVTHPTFAIHDVAIVNITAGNPTSGAGLVIVKGEGLVIEGCRFAGFYDDVDIQQYEYAHVIRNLFLDPVRFGLRIRNLEIGDQGDLSLTGNIFGFSGNYTRISQSGFRWESGGGCKIHDNKWNCSPRGLQSSWTTSMDINTADGCVTSIMLISGNSIENADYGILFQLVGPTYDCNLSKIVIIGNQIYSNIAPLTFNPAVIGKISNITIDDNTMGGGTYPIALTNVADVMLGTNNCPAYATLDKPFVSAVTNLSEARAAGRGNQYTPSTSGIDGTATSGGTEVRDASFPAFQFYAFVGRRYRVFVDRMILRGTVVGDTFFVIVRDGGASTPTTASPAITVSSVAIANTLGATVPINGTFTVSTTRLVTLAVFVQRYNGTGVGTPSANMIARELYAEDIGCI